jgi:hypothetical protein
MSIVAVADGGVAARRHRLPAPRSSDLFQGLSLNE